MQKTPLRPLRLIRLSRDVLHGHPSVNDGEDVSGGHHLEKHAIEESNQVKATRSGRIQTHTYAHPQQHTDHDGHPYIQADTSQQAASHTQSDATVSEKAPVAEHVQRHTMPKGHVGEEGDMKSNIVYTSDMEQAQELQKPPLEATDAAPILPPGEGEAQNLLKRTPGSYLLNQVYGLWFFLSWFFLTVIITHEISAAQYGVFAIALAAFNTIAYIVARMCLQGR